MPIVALSDREEGSGWLNEAKRRSLASLGFRLGEPWLRGETPMVRRSPTGDKFTRCVFPHRSNRQSPKIWLDGGTSSDRQSAAPPISHDPLTGGQEMGTVRPGPPRRPAWEDDRKLETKTIAFPAPPSGDREYAGFHSVLRSVRKWSTRGWADAYLRQQTLARVHQGSPPESLRSWYRSRPL